MKAFWVLSLKILLIIGIKKAAVLPVPVLASPIKSLPSKIAGIAWDWIGVGTRYPLFWILTFK